MARTSPPTPKPKMEEATREAISRARREITKAGQGRIFTVDLAASVVVAMDTTGEGDDGIPEGAVHRKKTLDYNQELAFDRLYISKTGKPILVFKPCDARDWKHCEIEITKVDGILPDFTPEIERAFAANHPNYKDSSNDPTMPEFYRNALKAGETVIASKKEQAQKELDSAMADIPNWGEF